MIRKKNRFYRLLGYFKPYSGYIFEVFIFMLIGIILSLLDPLIIKIIIDNALTNKNINLLSTLAIGLIAIFIFKGVIKVLIEYLCAYSGNRILFDIRNHLFQHLEKLSLSFYSSQKTGEIISRLDHDVTSLKEIFTETIIFLIMDLIIVLGIIVIIFCLNWKLALLTISFLPFFYLSLMFFNKRIYGKSKKSKEKTADIISFFQEIISGIILVKAFAREKYEARRHLKKSKELINLDIDLTVINTLMMVTTGLFFSLGTTSVLWYGGYQVIKGVMSIGSLVAFYTYIGRVFLPIQRLFRVNITIQSIRASADRIFEFLDIKVKDEKGIDYVVLKNIKGNIIFNDVSFAYNSNDFSIKNISFKLHPGEIIALAGPSGSGKTTIINLILRFYDPNSGHITIDGYDLKDLNLKYVRKNIGIAFQDSILFNCTIKENLKYGNNKATDKDMIEIASIVHIHDFIKQLPKGYSTIIGERGFKLSGGQKQRISLARALLKNPKILILDEATSWIDSQNEFYIFNSLKDFLKERTTIIITHRLYTIMNVNKIIVLSEGEILEVGNHTSLYKNCDIYKTLCDKQFVESGSNLPPILDKYLK